MANCQLSKSITKEHCAYEVAGIKEVYLINYKDASGIKVEKGEIATLPAEAVAYKVDFAENTASFTDELAEGGNGGKYRTHTLNFTIGSEGYENLNGQTDALSLSKFVAVIVDKSQEGGKAFMLGRNNGLNATSFNYESGAADADARGWTVVMAGTETETAPLLLDEAIKAVRESGNSNADSATIVD